MGLHSDSTGGKQLCENANFSKIHSQESYIKWILHMQKATVPY